MTELKKSSKSKKPNFQQNLDKILLNLTNSTHFSSQNQHFSQFNNIPQQKPTLLLHACCGPCSSYVLEYLVKYFQITVFYYNPNIYPPAEYERRFEELKNLYKVFPPAIQGNVQIVEKTYNPQEFYDAIQIKSQPELAKEREKGIRCKRCYEFRLKATFEYALQHNFDYFCTTLSISPFKDAQKLNEIGEFLEKNALNQQNSQEILQKKTEIQKFPKIPKWLPSDFKKKGGFKRSLEISNEYSLYRQEYCGCIYSKNSRNMIK